MSREEIGVSATVYTTDSDQWAVVYDNLSNVLRPFGAQGMRTLLTSFYLEEEEEAQEVIRQPVMETHDSNTLVRVEQAMIRSGLTKQQAELAMNELLNSGILFRERVQ